MKKETKCTAPGKCILFGEHAVVYGQSAISMGLKNFGSECIITRITEAGIQFNFPDYQKFLAFSNLIHMIENIPNKFSQFALGLKKLAETYNIKFEYVRITIKSSIWSGSGLGSSASTAVAFIRALNSYYDFKMDDNKISELSFEMEKQVHGTPSGIDNFTCTYGGFVFFKKGTYELLKIPENFNLLITYTGKPHNTRMAIEQVRTRKKENPKNIDQIFSSIGQLAQLAKKELDHRNLEEIGNLMNKNQEFLAELGISNKVINKINNIAISNGVYGSKLTGAGLGGCVISLGTKIALKNTKNTLKKLNLGLKFYNF
ncbi:MAG: mevalonate kinase [Promethearchaeota archaeon]